MKKFIIILFFSCSAQQVSSQPANPLPVKVTIDSLKHELKGTQNDTLRLCLFTQLRYNYFFVSNNLDSALFYSKQILKIAQKLNYQIDEAYGWDLIGDAMNSQNNESTLETFFKGVEIGETETGQKKMLPKKYLEKMLYWDYDFNANLLRNDWSPDFFKYAILGSLYQDLGRAYGRIMANQQKLIFYLLKAIDIHQSQKDTTGLELDYYTLSEYFNSTDQYDSCLKYAQKSFTLVSKRQEQSKTAICLSMLGTIYFKKEDYSKAVNLLRQSIEIDFKNKFTRNWQAYFTLSEYLLHKGVIDSSLFYAEKAYARIDNTNSLKDLQNVSELLAALYKQKAKNDSALKYYQLSLALNDSINDADKKRKLQSQDFDEQQHQQEIESSKIEFKNKVKVYALLAGVSVLILIAFLLLRNNKQRKKVNIVLDKKNKEIEHTLQNLKSTQAQLIQSEKMASLGELTAGIAHEIQNPLNFVNNFSEVNKEMIAELKEEINKGNYDDAKIIADDIGANEEKINHHGKRADAIVKGMLQHSRASTGKKDPTDINSLADEYLRLSYHGMRAKDKSFIATFKTDFDNKVGKINIVPQDIGRVLLNLFNNAFYAVTEKKKNSNENYEPTVFVCTKKIDSKVEIHVKDNGVGIPQKVVDKIFQPFFTTKPTGQGTGLGLSLSYDIIKAHGGEIKVETEEGKRTEFIIELPINKPL